MKATVNPLTANFHNRNMPSVNGFMNWKQENQSLIKKYGLRLVFEYYWQRHLFGNQTKPEVFKTA